MIKGIQGVRWRKPRGGWIALDWLSGVRIIRDLGSNALPAVPEAAAVAVHLQDMDVVGETVQQRLRSGALSRRPRSIRRRAGLVVTRIDPRSQRWLKTSKSNSAPVRDRGTKPSSSMISRLRRRQVVSVNSAAVSHTGPPAVRFTSFSPARRPSAVPQPGRLPGLTAGI